MTTVVPSAGQSPDFLQLGPGASASYGAIDLRRAAGAGLQEGVIGATGGSYKVTLSSGMILTIAASTVDGALVQGDTISAQGLYFVPPHSAAITETVTAAHATLPRIDMVVLEILDANHDGGGSNLARTRIIAGTATGGATLDNRTGAAALPSSAIRLADVLVPAAAASILAANIRDRRPWAMGAQRVINRVSADYTVTGTSLALVDATNVQPRLECSGVPLIIKAHMQVEHSAAVLSRFAVFSDAAVMTGLGTAPEWPWDPGANRLSGINPNWDYTPVAGSHLIGLAVRTTSGTLTIRANSTNGMQFSIREDIRQNVDQT